MFLSEEPINTLYIQGVDYFIPLEVGQKVWDKYDHYDRSKWAVAKLTQYNKPVLQNTYINQVYRWDRLIGYKISTYDYTEAAKK